MTLNATPEAILAAVTPRTKAVVVVHFAGLSRRHERAPRASGPLGIPVVEDTAHAFPSRSKPPADDMRGLRQGRRLLVLRDEDHHTGEGGMLVTDDEEIADRARLMSLHGISRNAWNRYAAGGSWYYEIEDVGYKYNMTDMAAALGLVQLDRAGGAARCASWRSSRSTRSASPAVRSAISWNCLPIRPMARTPGTCSSSGCNSIGCHRSWRGHRRAEGPGSGPASISSPCTCTRTTSPRATCREAFPVATREYERVLSLPIWPGLTAADVDRVVDTGSSRSCSPPAVESRQRVRSVSTLDSHPA